MRKKLSAILCILIILSFMVQALGFVSIPVKSIKLNSSAITLEAGKTYTLKVTFTPSNTSQKLVKFSTSNSSIASVDAKGNIKGKKVGKATITVSSLSNNKVTTKCSVTVKAANMLNGPGVYPISKVKTKLTIGLIQTPSVQDYKTNAMTKILEEIGNVNLEFKIFPAVDALPKLALLISSATPLPDLISGYFGDLSPYTSTGAFTPVDKYLDDPNIAYYFHKRIPADIREFMLTTTRDPDGNIYGMPSVAPEIGNEYSFRHWINKTWLDKLGLKMPKTTDEYYNVLKAFKTNDPNGNGIADEIPLMGSTNGWNQRPQETIMNAFIYANPAINYLMAENGKLDIAYNKPEWKAGLEYMSKLVKEGLLSPLTFTQDQNQFKTIIEDKNAQVVGSIIGGSMSIYQAGSLRRRDIVIMPPLTGPKGVNYSPYNPQIPTISAYITKYCRNPELAVRVSDYMYDETMSMHMRFGVKGVDWDTNVAGLKGLYEDSLGVKVGFRQINNTWGGPQNAHWGGPALAGYRGSLDPLSMQGTAVPEDPYDYRLATANAIPLYLNKHPKEVISKIIYTGAESRQIAEILASLSTFRSESTLRFIMGDKPMTEWDSYCKELKAIGLDKYLEITQKAYTRMNAKR